MAAFENITDISGFKSGEQFYIDKYDSKSYDNIEKTMDEILNKKDNDVIKEYITKYIPEEERSVTYNFKCSTNTMIKLNDRFIASQMAAAAPPPDSDDNEFKALAIEKTLFNSIKNYSSIVEERNKALSKRYIILREKLLKNEIRRKLEKQQQSMFAFLNKITYLGVISGATIFCVKLVLISNLTNPAVWIGFLSKIYANPLYFQYFTDIVSSLQIFTMTETLTLKDKFSKLQLLMKQIPLFQNKKYVDALVKCIFDPTPGCLQNIESNKEFEGHDKNPQLMQFFTYIKSVTDAKKVFKKTDIPSEKKPIWEKNLLNELFSFYTSPIGYNALTSLKLATDAYGYFSQSIDFFSKYKDANPALLFKGITVNSVNSYSFNVYSRIFTQKLLNTMIGGQDGTFILDIPIFGKQDVNTFFVTTLDSFLNIQTKSMVTGYFTKLEQEVGYDPEKEKKEKENEKKNSIEGIKEDIIKRGTLVKKYEGYGYSNQQIAKIISKPERPNNYKFFLARYMKNFYNTFLDVLDDPLVAIEIFTNVSFVFNIIQNNFYSIIMGGGLMYLPKMVLTGVAHKSFLNLGSLTGNLIPFEIVPIKILTAYFRFKYGSDIVINRQIELLKYSLVNDIFSDIQTLFNEMQSLFFDTSLGMSVNRYLETLNDTIIGKLFNISCKICYLFVNFAVLPTVKNKIITFIPSIKFPIIETLENREKSERLFTFIDNKMSNIVKLSQNKMDEGMELKDIFKVIKQDFGEFVNISKIIEGTIIPYINAEGFFEWSGKMKSPLEGAVIKFVEESEDDKLTAYAGDILSEEKQEKLSHVTDVKIVLGTDDSGYGNFKVVDTKDIKDLLVKVYDDDSKYDPRNKREDKNIFGKLAEIAEKTIFGEDYETYKANILAKGWGFTDDNIKILYEDGITFEELENVMKEKDVTFEKVMASILVTDSLRYKRKTTGGRVINLFSGDTGNLAKDFSMSNIYYYYYYKIFINEKLASKKAEFEKKQMEKKAEQEAEIQKLVVGSKIMYNNKPAIIEQINSDGTFNIKGNDGKVIENVNKELITPQVGSLRTQSKEDQNTKDEKEFKEIIERDEKKLSKQDDYDAFAAFLQEKFNAIELLKREDKPYSVYEHGIISDMLTSLKTRESIVTHNYLWDNKGDVVKSVFFADTGIDYLKGFFDRLYSGNYDNPINPNIKLKTEILEKSKLVHTEGKNVYFGINLQHSYGFSPQVVDAKKFLNSIEMLIALNSENDQIGSLSNIITVLEAEAAKDVNIQQSLDELNELYKKPITDITSYYQDFVEYFKSIFCNIKSEGCNKENMIFFRHINFNYSGFYDKIKDIFGKTDILTSLENMVKNNYIQNFLKNNAEIKYTCNLNGKVMFLNKNFIDMNTGNLMSECINNSSEIDFTNKEMVLQILLRPETIFSLSKIYDLPGDAYSQIKSSSIDSTFDNLIQTRATREKLEEFDMFFKLFKGLGQDGIKSTTDAKNISIFSIISDTINNQEKDYNENTIMDPIEKDETQLLFNFNKILKSQTGGVIDPAIQQAYINYFTQKEDILDDTSFLNINQTEVETLFNNFNEECKKDVTNATKLINEIKKNYFDKDATGAINLNGNILRLSDIKFEDSPALNTKLLNYVKYLDEILKQQNGLKTIFKSVNLCSDLNKEYIENYIKERQIWYKKQSEIFKLYILHNTNNIFSVLTKNYDKFTDDVSNVVDDYYKNLSIIWNDVNAKKQDIATPSPQLVGIAETLERKRQSDIIDSQVKQQKIQDISTDKEKMETAKKMAQEETTALESKTDEKVTEETDLESKTEESLDSKLQYGTSANPNHFGNFLNSLITVSPSTIYTNAFKTKVTIDTEIKEKVEEENKLTNPSAQCALNSQNWNIGYSNEEQSYTVQVSGDLTENDINSYNCKTTNLMHEVALNVNKIIIYSSQFIIGVLQAIALFVKKIAPQFYPYVAILIKMSQAYSSCYIYMFHQVMFNKFSDQKMAGTIDKPGELTNGDANLSDKLMFGLWTQMVITLKEAEGGKPRSNTSTCGLLMTSIGGQDITKIEENAYDVINSIGMQIGTKENMNNNITPALNNLPGYIDAGLSENGINYSNYIEVAPKVAATFLNESEQKEYDELISKPSISCSDLGKLKNNTKALKFSIYSLILNPTKSFFLINLSCRLFGSENADFYNKDDLSLWQMFYILLFTDWKELIKDFMTIMFTNEGLKPLFLTKLFGNKSQGAKLNFIRDLIDDSFETAKKTYKNEKDYENYIKNDVSNSIYKFILGVVTSFFGILFDLDKKINGTWVGINQKIYKDFRDCKSGLCSFEQVQQVTKKAILDVQTVLANVNTDFEFDTSRGITSINLESEPSKQIINRIVNSKSYEDFIDTLKTTDESIYSNPDISAQWSKAIYQQYKEVMVFYKDYSEYNTAIIKHLNKIFKEGQNVGFQYRVANYNYYQTNQKNKNPDFLNGYLIKPCPEGQILYFFNKGNEVSFNCLDFSDVNTNEFDKKQQDYENKFDESYKTFAENALKNNIKIIDLFVNSKSVICNNSEYCSSFSVNDSDYVDFVETSNKKFKELVSDEKKTKKEIEDFQKSYFEELKTKLKELLDIYIKIEKELLQEISAATTKLSELNKQLSDVKEENDKVILLKLKEGIQENLKNLEDKLYYFKENINKINNNKTGLLQNIKEIQEIGSITTPEVVTQQFILSELNKKDISPDYFAYLYCKLFFITEDNPDILNLFEFFNSTGKDIEGLASKITNNKYYFTNESDAVINTKLLENEGVRQAILKNLKVFLSKNQKEQYMYTGKSETKFYIKDEETGRRVKVEDGFDIVKDTFSKTMPHDEGIEETKKDLIAIQEQKFKLENKIEKTKRIKEFRLKSLSEEEKEIVKLKDELEAKKQEIQDKLAEIRKLDEKYYKDLKVNFYQKKKEEENEAKIMENARKEYNKAVDEYNKLIKGWNDDYYKQTIEPFLKEIQKDKEEMGMLDLWLKGYRDKVQAKAEEDYTKKREEARIELLDLIEKNTEIEKDLIYNKDVTIIASKYAEWEQNLEKINKLDSFLMKSDENIKFDIELLASQYYDTNKNIDGFAMPQDYTSIENIKKKYEELYSKSSLIPEYVQTAWQIIKATIKTGFKKFTRWLGFGESDNDREVIRKKAEDKVNNANRDLKSAIIKWHTIRESNSKIEKALFGYIEKQVDPSKRFLFNFQFYGDFLEYDKIKNGYNSGKTLEGTEFSEDMIKLRQDYDELQKGLQDIQKIINKKVGDLDEKQRANIKEIDEMMAAIEMQKKVIDKKEKQLIKDIEVRKQRYEDLLIKVEKSDKEQLAELNHKFGYSIKIDGKGQISLQKTSNAFKSNSVEEKLLNSFKQKEETKGVLSSITSWFSSKKQTPEKNLGKDSNGNPLPLNSNTEIVDDKVKDGFPPILVASNIGAIMGLEDVDVNIYAEEYLGGWLKGETKNLDEFSKQKIKQYIQKHYTLVNGFYIMKAQLKFWGGAFEGFEEKDFGKALQDAMEQKKGNAEKFKDYEDYRVTEPGLGPDKTTIAPTQENIDNVFGVSFNYFDSLKIRGVDKSHIKEQGSINAIRDNKNTKGKMIDGAILNILPLNIYGANLNNYEIDFEHDTFELFFPGRITLTR